MLYIAMHTKLKIWTSNTSIYYKKLDKNSCLLNKIFAYFIDIKSIFYTKNIDSECFRQSRKHSMLATDSFEYLVNRLCNK